MGQAKLSEWSPDFRSEMCRGDPGENADHPERMCLTSVDGLERQRCVKHCKLVSVESPWRPRDEQIESQRPPEALDLREYRLRCRKSREDPFAGWQKRIPRHLTGAERTSGLLASPCLPSGWNNSCGENSCQRIILTNCGARREAEAALPFESLPDGRVPTIIPATVVKPLESGIGCIIFVYERQ